MYANRIHTSDVNGDENFITYGQMMVDAWEFAEANGDDTEDLRSLPAAILVDNPASDTNPRLTVVIGDVSYTQHPGVMTMPGHWPANDSHEYSCVVEVAIGLIAAGYGAADADMLDDTGTSVSDDLQTNLMDAMFRSKAMYEMFSKMEQLMTGAIIAHANNSNRES